MPWYWQCLSNQFDSIRFFFFFHTLLKLFVFEYTIWIPVTLDSTQNGDDFKPRFIERNANIYCFAKRLSHWHSFQRILRASFSPLHSVWKSFNLLENLRSYRCVVKQNGVKWELFSYPVLKKQMILLGWFSSTVLGFHFCFLMIWPCL